MFYFWGPSNKSIFVDEFLVLNNQGPVWKSLKRKVFLCEHTSLYTLGTVPNCTKPYESVKRLEIGNVKMSIPIPFKAGGNHSNGFSQPYITDTVNGANGGTINPRVMCPF